MSGYHVGAAAAAAGTACFSRIHGASLKYKAKKLPYKMAGAGGGPGTKRYRSPASVRMYR
jgi:hypothetical protein